MRNDAEIIVRWYLRFNGYLTVENFVVHSARGHQLGEFDVVGVRFPHWREVPISVYREPEWQHPIMNDRGLDDELALQNELVDFVICEVKSGTRGSLNPIWSENDKLKVLAYLLHWLGAISDQKDVDKLAEEFQKTYRATYKNLLFRLVYFSPTRDRSIEKKNVTQITFEDIVNFFLEVRAPCWIQYGGVRSAHDQWDDLIKKIWNICDSMSQMDQVEKRQQLLQLFQANESGPQSTRDSGLHI